MKLLVPASVLIVQYQLKRYIIASTLKCISTCILVIKMSRIQFTQTFENFNCCIIY